MLQIEDAIKTMFAVCEMMCDSEEVNSCSFTSSNSNDEPIAMYFFRGNLVEESQERLEGVME